VSNDRPNGVTVEPTRWLVLSALVPPAGEEYLMVAALRRLGARAITREGERVIAWLAAPRAVERAVRAAESAIRASTSMTDPALTWWWETHDEWVARWVRAVEPRRVTARIVVAPIGREFERGAGDVVIRLEAGVAFGTAEHGTTRGCLRLLERLLRRGDRVADIGTGSGVLAVAAALLGARHVLALDADPLACAGARRNATANGVAARVEVREVTVGPADLQTLPPCDVVLANLEAGIIGTLLPGLRDVLAPGGRLIASGVTAGERRTVLAAAAAAGLVPYEQADEAGWLSVVFVREA
jgi:ribosomal protein L11 methyltransferase